MMVKNMKKILLDLQDLEKVGVAKRIKQKINQLESGNIKMDYKKAYDEVIEINSKQVDIFNFIDNKLTDLDMNNIELEKQAQDIRELIEMVKQVQIMYLKDLHKYENDLKRLKQ